MYELINQEDINKLNIEYKGRLYLDGTLTNGYENKLNKFSCELEMTFKLQYFEVLINGIINNELLKDSSLNLLLFEVWRMPLPQNGNLFRCKLFKEKSHFALLNYLSINNIDLN